MTLNLTRFVTDPFSTRAVFDFAQFWRVTYEAARLADTLVDLELDAIDAILDKIDRDPEPPSVKACERELWQLLRSAARSGRRIGLGFSGLADVFAALNLPFDSDDALRTLEAIMRTKCEAEFTASIDLAVLRGPFDGYDADVDKTSQFVQMLEAEFPELAERMRRHGRRNISLSTVPPCGTLSLMAGISSGIEPVFRTTYTRRRRVKHDDPHARVDFTDELGDTWQEFEMYHPGVRRWMRRTGSTDVTKSPYHGSTADRIDWHRRVEIQAMVQKYTTHSISSTINLPPDVTVEQVDRIFRFAWEAGLKGLTIYRESSRSGVYLDAGAAPDDQRAEAEPGTAVVCSDDACEVCEQ